jgi:hypothetical protein
MTNENNLNQNFILFFKIVVQKIIHNLIHNLIINLFLFGIFLKKY